MKIEGLPLCHVHVVVRAAPRLSRLPDHKKGVHRSLTAASMPRPWSQKGHNTHANVTRGKQMGSLSSSLCAAPDKPTQPRPIALSSAQTHRTLLQPPQAVPSARHPLLPTPLLVLGNRRHHLRRHPPQAIRRRSRKLQCRDLHQFVIACRYYGRFLDFANLLRSSQVSEALRYGHNAACIHAPCHPSRR